MTLRIPVASDRRAGDRPGPRATLRAAAGALALVVAGLAAAEPGPPAEPRAGSGPAGASTRADVGPTLQRILSTGVLRVCIWPEYYGVTYRHPRDETLSGIDIDLSNELAKELGVRLRYVESSFQRVVADLDGERCDVAMFAVGVLPQRREALAFTQPYLQSDIYAITMRASRVVKRWEDIDQPGVVVAVQAGTFMEPVMRDALRRAKLLVVQPPATRERELESGRADVFMTDYPYSRRLLDNADWATLVAPPKPFHVLPYAYAVKRGDASWLARMDDFVARIKRDGRLRDAAARHGLSAIVVP
ncbi:substrate-binding periplasmic protein [Roseateles chitosanitabidus]|uniref:substrate-binding periplasmic protein n=1 Tax=Roseateles chitosanitabidus TaxID=65048 RepID=UPI000A03A6E9|nr:ABC transporter substrate-binding protein [Roseateles chitosanitabidus]MBO9687696.1 amino acid ABC transporter substrate-binding protein [Roseateles chitosanitabidus]